jgi:UDP-glucose 4-epimerase
MKSVMVTGATTPLGAAIVEQIIKDKRAHTVLAVGAELYEDVRGLFPDSAVVYLQADLTHTRELRNLLYSPAKDLQVETVIHTALHRSAHAVGMRVHQLNVDSTYELLRLSERHPTIRSFILRSHAEIYRTSALEPEILDERHPIDLSPSAPQWLRDRAEADLTTCANMGLSPLSIKVLRCAECVAPDMGSQLFDYLTSQVCFTALGFDPMLNVISLPDLARAFSLAVASPAHGVFNIVGKDTLPLSELIHKTGRICFAVPATMLTPLYYLRSKVIGSDFRYDLNRFRFHFSGVMDGKRAKEVLSYSPIQTLFRSEGSQDSPAHKD